MVRLGVPKGCTIFIAEDDEIRARRGTYKGDVGENIALLQVGGRRVVIELLIAVAHFLPLILERQESAVCSAVTLQASGLCCSRYNQ